MRSEMNDQVRPGGDPDRGEPRPQEARHCPVCGVKLSAYNQGRYCWTHTIGWPWRGPSAPPRL